MIQVLVNFSIDNSLKIKGYVQGMNFITAALLYHAEEYVAFWILVSIFEFLEMRDIFLPSIQLKYYLLNNIELPGLSKHCQMIDMLILNAKPKIYSKLVNKYDEFFMICQCAFEIRSEMYCSEWVLTLFSSVVPVTEMV